MKKLKIVSIIIIALSFIACHNLLKNSKIVLYKNTSPVFSISYPVDWVEKKAEPPFVFMAESPKRLSELRIYVSPDIFAPLDFSTNLYISYAAQIGKNIKLLYNKEVKLNDGSRAQIAEIEWEDNSGTKLNTFFLTKKKVFTWITISLTNRGRVNEDLKKIAYSLKIKPEEKTIAVREDIFFIFEIVTIPINN